MSIVKRRTFGSAPPNLRGELKQAFPQLPDKEISTLVLLGAVFGDYAVNIYGQVAYIRNGHVSHVERKLW